MSGLLDRALEAEEALEAAHDRITDLETRLSGVLNAEPESATRALGWMQRAENSESLVAELVKWLEENPSVEELLPTGFSVRLRTQIKTIAILRRDQAQFGEKPADDEWWSRYQNGDVRTSPDRPDITTANG